jgi:heme oxygenase
VHGDVVPATAVLDRLRVETRQHQCVADADRLAFVERKAGAEGYREYLIRAHGFETPLESALGAAPGLRDLIKVDVRANSRILTRELVDLGFAVQDLLLIEHCRLVVLTSLAEACGWLYVAWRNRAAHEVLRTFVARRYPDAVRWKPEPAEHTPLVEWDELGRVLEDVARTSDPAIIVDAALKAYDCQHFWFHANAPSGTAFTTATKVAEQRLRETDRIRRFVRPPTGTDE